MSNTTQRKPGSGRTKGSFSFVKIPLAQLKGKFADDTIEVPVYTKWAAMAGFKNFNSTPSANTFESIVGKTPETAVQVEVVDLNPSPATTAKAS